MGYRRNIWKDGSSYRVRKEWRGKVYKRTLRTRRNAELWLEQLERRLLSLPTDEPAPLLHDAFVIHEQWLRSRNRSEETLRYYAEKHRALRALPNMRLTAITQNNIEDYLGAREVSPGTINKELSALYRVYKLAKIDPLWQWEPLSHQAGERMVYTPDRIAQVWRLLSPAAQTVCGLCLFAALRASEAHRVERSWVQEDTLWVAVRKRRDAMRTALVKTLANLIPADDPIVRITPQALDNELRRVSDRVGITPALRGPGILRHHAATWGVDYSEGRFSEEDARRVLGHHRQGATARYVHSQAVERKRAFLEVVERVFTEALQG